MICRAKRLAPISDQGATQMRSTKLPRMTLRAELALYRAVCEARRLLEYDENAWGAVTCAARRHGCDEETVAMLVNAALDGCRRR